MHTADDANIGASSSGRRRERIQYTLRLTFAAPTRSSVLSHRLCSHAHWEEGSAGMRRIVDDLDLGACLVRDLAAFRHSFPPPPPRP